MRRQGALPPGPNPTALAPARWAHRGRPLRRVLALLACAASSPVLFRWCGRRGTRLGGGVGWNGCGVQQRPRACAMPPFVPFLIGVN